MFLYMPLPGTFSLSPTTLAYDSRAKVKPKGLLNLRPGNTKGGYH
jgi:hypothetical protein